MVTKYNTGDRVLIPMTIESAVSKDDKIFYNVIAHGERLEKVVPEDEIKLENPTTACDGVRVPIMIGSEKIDEVTVKISR